MRKQEATSAIVRSAHEINSGIMPVSMLRQTAGQLQVRQRESNDRFCIVLLDMLFAAAFRNKAIRSSHLKVLMLYHENSFERAKC